MSLRPLEGKLKRVAKPSWLQVMPSQRQQLLEVQFKEGEERVRAKAKREVCSVWLHCMHEYVWRRGVERERRLSIEPLDDHADCKLLVRIHIHILSDWREFPA